MVKKTICTEKVIDFAQHVEMFLCECIEEKDVRPLFEEAIVDDKDKEKEFFDSLPKVKGQLQSDLAFFMESDPASDSEEEVVFAYPGYKAIMYYRVSHLLVKMGYRFVARIISEHAHFLTGIDIHPAATIGCPFFIDHGTGIVIGETTIIGNRVKIYQGVTLGAISLSQGNRLKGQKRHPTIGNNVTIYSGASILGGEVAIGNNVVIGSNVFVLESIPADCKVVLPKPELILIKK